MAATDTPSQSLHLHVPPMGVPRGETEIRCCYSITREQARSCKRHACHGLVFCETKDRLLGTHPQRFTVSAQMRFDGAIGFPGGLLDGNETLEECMNREFQEEIGYSSVIFSQQHYISTHIYNDIALHFYAQKISEAQLHALEEASRRSTHFGEEVLGLIRVPLVNGYFYNSNNNDGDGDGDGEESKRRNIDKSKKKDRPLSGFPMFLCNRFAGCALQQMCLAFVQNGILTEQDIDVALQRIGVADKNGRRKVYTQTFKTVDN